ncbi:MAG: hypothetical protein WEB89_11525, partial [Balneolales bacterium]
KFGVSQKVIFTSKKLTMICHCAERILCIDGKNGVESRQSNLYYLPLAPPDRNRAGAPER